MKQNEKILVYAVTGFLVVILMVAILFGKDGVRRDSDIAQQPDTVRSLEDVLNDRAGGALASHEGQPGGATPQPGVDPVDPVVPQGEEVGADPLGLAGDDPLAGDPAVDPLGSRALAVNVPLQPPTAAALVTEKLGLNRREHDFRIVRARAGDSLGSLVQAWCGTTTDYLDIARGLNEELSVLRIGQEVVLPWVDDEEVLAAWEARGSRAAAGPVAAETPAGAAGAGGAAAEATLTRDVAGEAPVPAVTASRKYKIQPGDSLWKIAEREVGRNGAPRFLDQVRGLNPGLDVDRLKVGQLIQLPAKG